MRRCVFRAVPKNTMLPLWVICEVDSPRSGAASEHRWPRGGQLNILVVYDSVNGNTEALAKAMGAAITGKVTVIKAGAVNPGMMEKADLLIVGSPTLGGKPTQAVQSLLAGVSKAALKGKGFAAFDTRISMGFAKIFGYAALKIADALTACGGTAKAAPEGFIVKGRKGPLAEGELECLVEKIVSS